MNSSTTLAKCQTGAAAQSRAKRLMDVVLSLLLLVLLAPVLIVVSAAVRMRMGRPVIFRQERPGLRERRFTLYKFRTLINPSGDRQYTEPDRLTPLGRFLRRSSLDELPELFNVLSGHMSLVGPRPLLVRYLPYYRTEERARHTVRPGMTGWAQIHGRNKTTWDERLALDVWYVENWSLRLDMYIVARTLGAVVRGSGVVVTPSVERADLDEERRPTDVLGAT